MERKINFFFKHSLLKFFGRFLNVSVKRRTYRKRGFRRRYWSYGGDSKYLRNPKAECRECAASRAAVTIAVDGTRVQFKRFENR